MGVNRTCRDSDRRPQTGIDGNAQAQADTDGREETRRDGHRWAQMGVDASGYRRARRDGDTRARGGLRVKEHDAGIPV